MEPNSPLYIFYIVFEHFAHFGIIFANNKALVCYTESAQGIKIGKGISNHIGRGRRYYVMASKPTGHARSAITGRYVTISYAQKNPKTTVIEKK